MTEVVQSPLVQSLAWALTHFVWQGVAIALVALAVMRLAGNRPSVRYAVGVTALAVMMAAPCLTVITLTTVPAPPAPDMAVANSPAALPAAERVAATSLDEPQPAAAQSPVILAAVVAAWLAGVVGFSVRLLGGWIVARRLTRTAVKPAATHIQALAASVAERLALREAVAVLESSVVAVPVVVGWLTPAIVLPVAALAGLSPAQIEALLAHELAHVRRHDYLVNVLQSIAEVVLFYHPAVWVISRRVRRERELCCDDLAVGICDRVVYATALTDLAAMTSPRLALAATDGDLLSRIRRILTPKETDMSIASAWSPAVGVVLIAGLLVPVSLASARQEPAKPAPKPAATVARVTSADAPPPERAGAGDVSVLRARGGVTATMTGGDAAVLTVVAQEISLEMGEAASQAEPPTVQSQQARREAEVRAARQDADIQTARRELERVRKLFEVGLVSSTQVLEAEARLAVLEARGDVEAQRAAEAAAVTRQLADARKRQEIGTMSADDVAALEGRLARLQAQGDAVQSVKVELDLARRQLERSKQLYERGLIASEALREAEARLKTMEQRAELEMRNAALEQERAVQRQVEEVRVREADAVRAAAERDRATRARAEELRAKGADIAPEAAPEVDPARPFGPGEILSVIITGEPDLPTTYRVQADGTIRLPLLGSFKVVGQTAAQVQTAIGKQLADRRLGSASQVHVARRVATRIR